MDQVTAAAMFFTASLLYGAGFVIISIFIIVINNLIAKYWQYLGWFRHLNFVNQDNQPRVDKIEPRVKD